ncbi:MAG: Uma2 family endonuclease [Bacteroidota bacterium]
MKESQETEIEPELQVLNEPTVEYHHEYTYADYLKFQFEEMVEIIRGKIYKMSPAPKSKHQALSRNLEINIGYYLKDKKCQIFDAPFDVILPIADKKRKKATTVVQPDLCIICNPTLIEENGCFGVPNWIIEILSQSTAKKDLDDKYKVYEEAGVSEYWIVSPEYETIEIYLLENGKYAKKHIFDKTDMVSPFTLPELTINLNEVFC